MGVLTGCILRQFLSISASIIPLNLHARVKWVLGSCSSDKENNCSKIIQLINNYTQHNYSGSKLSASSTHEEKKSHLGHFTGSLGRKSQHC